MYIDNVQPWAKPCLALSPNGKHLAVALSGILASDSSLDCTDALPDRSQADHIAIFSGISWRKEKVGIF